LQVIGVIGHRSIPNQEYPHNPIFEKQNLSKWPMMMKMLPPLSLTTVPECAKVCPSSSEESKEESSTTLLQSIRFKLSITVLLTIADFSLFLFSRIRRR
jgi:hypothetical protein